MRKRFSFPIIRIALTALQGNRKNTLKTTPIMECNPNMKANHNNLPHDPENQTLIELHRHLHQDLGKIQIFSASLS